MGSGIQEIKFMYSFYTTRSCRIEVNDENREFIESAIEEYRNGRMDEEDENEAIEKILGLPSVDIYDVYECDFEGFGLEIIDWVDKAMGKTLI